MLFTPSFACWYRAGFDSQAPNQRYAPEVCDQVRLLNGRVSVYHPAPPYGKLNVSYSLNRDGMQYHQVDKCGVRS